MSALVARLFTMRRPRTAGRRAPGPQWPAPALLWACALLPLVLDVTAFAFEWNVLYADPVASALLPVVAAGWLGTSRGALLAAVTSVPLLVDLVQPPIDFAFHAQLPVIDAVLFIGLSSVIVYWKHVVEASYLDKTKLSEALDTLRQFKRAIDEHAIVTTADPDGRITHANAKFCEVSQYDRAEVLGKDHRVLNSGHHAPAFFEALWSTITSGEVWHGEIKNRAKDGTFYWVAMTIMPVVRPNGRLEQFIAIRTDITDRKRAEEQLLQFNRNLEALVEQRTVEVRQALETLDAAPDGTLVFEAESLRIKFVSAGAVRQVGYDRRELLEMTVADLSTAHTAEALRQALAATGTAVHSILRSTFRRKTGDEFPVEMSLTSAKAERDTPDCIAVIRDITDRLTQEQRLQQAQRFEALGSLTGGIAHDLNNALAPVTMGLSMLRQEHPDKSATLEVVEAAAQRAAGLVSNLVNFTRNSKTQLDVIDFATFVEETAAFIRVGFPKNIHLDVECPVSLPDVYGDATQLQQVLLNLCVNARDAMPNGGRIKIAVSSFEVDSTYSMFSRGGKTGNFIRVDVRDSGTGMPPKVLERIFDPFFTTKGTAGAGLGLSIVQGILKAHSGFVEVSSTPGDGTSVRFYLPTATETETEHSEAIEVSPSLASAPRKCVLLVDDDEPVRTIGQTVLEALDYKVLTAADGPEALALAAEHHTELAAVITDLHMPQMDGLVLIDALHDLFPGVPVVLSSGQLRDALSQEMSRRGVHRLDKPFNAAQLRDLLRRITDRPA